MNKLSLVLSAEKVLSMIAKIIKVSLHCCFILAFMLQVRDQFTKYWKQKTTMAFENVKLEDLHFPDLIICSQIPFKTDVIEKLGLPEDFWRSSFISNRSSSNIMPSSVGEAISWWNQSTFAPYELITHAKLYSSSGSSFGGEKEVASLNVTEIPSSSEGRCYKLASEITVQTTEEIILISLQIPEESAHGLTLFVVMQRNSAHMGLTAKYWVGPFEQMDLKPGTSVNLGTTKQLKA